MSTPPPLTPANQPSDRPFTTPPGFGQPGVQPPGGFAPGGGIAPPPWQPGGSGPPPGLTAPVTPTGKSKAPVVVGIVAVVAILVAVGVFVLGGDSGSGGIGSASAGRGLEAVLRDGSYDESGYQELGTCPLGDIDDLTAAVGKVLELDEAVAEAEPLYSQTEEGDFPGFVACQVYPEDDVRDGPAGLYFQAIFDPPRRYEGYVEDFSGDSTSIEFQDSVRYRGGEVFLFCAEANDENGFTGCEADWVNTDDNIALAMYLSGDNLDSDDAFTALKAVITAMASSLAEFDTGES